MADHQIWLSKAAGYFEGWR